jgi:hypothetical protein
MRLVEWVDNSRNESENLDVFLQIVRLLREKGKGQGIISSALYEVDENNDVTYVGSEKSDGVSGGFDELRESFSPPEGEIIPEKSDVFSLGLLLDYLLRQEVAHVERPVVSGFPFKSRKKINDTAAVKAQDSTPVSILLERMTAYEPDYRTSLREVESVLSSSICKVGIVLENIHTKEQYPEITRSFTGTPVYKFTPEKEYVFNLATVAPVSAKMLELPYRLVKKQYVIEVVYSAQGRWGNAVRKDGGNTGEAVEEFSTAISYEASEDSAKIPKSTAALHFCDKVYGIEGDALFCETDGYTYEMGLYEYERNDENKSIGIVREGEVAVPERIEARALSILREVSKTITDLFCVVVYARQGELNPEVVKAINDIFPEAVRIYRLETRDLIKGAKIFNEKNL